MRGRLLVWEIVKSVCDFFNFCITRRIFRVRLDAERSQTEQVAAVRRTVVWSHNQTGDSRAAHTFPRNSQHSLGDWRMGSRNHHNNMVTTLQPGICIEIRVFIRCFDDLYKPDLACLCRDLTSARMLPANSNHLISTV